MYLLGRVCSLFPNLPCRSLMSLQTIYQYLCHHKTLQSFLTNGSNRDGGTSRPVGRRRRPSSTVVGIGEKTLVLIMEFNTFIGSKDRFLLISAIFGKYLDNTQTIQYNDKNIRVSIVVHFSSCLI